MDETIKINHYKQPQDRIVNKTKDQTTWLDYRDPSLSSYPEDMLTASIKHTIDYLRSKYKLKRVTVKDDNRDVGFLVYSKTNERKERISHDETPIDIILITAIDPKYRNQGILKQMMDKSKIKRPFIVHTSKLSTPQVWERIGCKPVKDLGGGNKVEKC